MAHAYVCVDVGVCFGCQITFLIILQERERKTLQQCMCISHLYKLVCTLQEGEN